MNADINTISTSNLNKDYTVFRMICLISAMASPLLTATLSMAHLTQSTSIPVCIFFSVLFLFLFTLTYISPWVRKHAYFILYMISYFSSIELVYFTAKDNFSYVYTLLLTLVIFSIALLVKKIGHFLYYAIGILALIITALYFNPSSSTNKAFITAFFTILFLVAFTYMKLKNGVEKALVESEEHYRNLVEISPQAIVVHQDGTIKYANPAAIKLAAASGPEDLIGKSITDFIHTDYKSKSEQRLKKALQGDKVDDIEMQLIGVDGRVAFVEASMIGCKHHGRPAAMSLFKDISERKMAEEQIKYLAYYDELTGLPNRHSLNDDLNRLLVTNLKNEQIGILFIDLDGFKTINATLGHNFGDILLSHTSKRLRNCVRKDDIIYRYGGDEFVIILRDINPKDSSLIAQKILKDFEHPFIINNQEVFTSPSIGISIYPIDGRDVDTLIKNADAAMYHAKDYAGKNYQFFAPCLNDAVSRKLVLENGLRRALTHHEFILYYQPQIELKTGRIIGMEALIRWNHPTLGMVPPSEFIPIAEETGLIIPIGAWVLRTACRQNKVWQECGYTPITIAVNISGVQFQQANFVETIKTVLHETGLDPHFLEIEITESIIQEMIKISEVVKEIKSLGIAIAIDDFGTGYSSLSLLKHLTIDSLKMDPSFTRDIYINPNALVLLKFVIEMGHHLNLKIVAEGVEYEQQLHILEQCHCDWVQGYFFSRPQPAEDLDALFKEYQDKYQNVKVAVQK